MRQWSYYYYFYYYFFFYVCVYFPGLGLRLQLEKRQCLVACFGPHLGLNSYFIAGKICFERTILQKKAMFIYILNDDNLGRANIFANIICLYFSGDNFLRRLSNLSLVGRIVGIAVLSSFVGVF